jgi:hypothetical protein
MHQKDIREHAQLRLGIADCTDAAQWPIPNVKQVEDYNNGHSCDGGPTNNDLRMDWFSKRMTPWTEDCAVIFAHDFLQQRRNGAFPFLRGQYTAPIITAAFKDHIVYLKRKYHRAKEDDAKANQDKLRADQRARTVNRRQQVNVPDLIIRRAYH